MPVRETMLNEAENRVVAILTEAASRDPRVAEAKEIVDWVSAYGGSEDGIMRSLIGEVPVPDGFPALRLLREVVCQRLDGGE